MGARQLVTSGGRLLLDFVLPPRCSGCGTIVDDVDLFCAACWGEVEWMTGAGCDRCGHPLEASEETICAACLARPPRIDRVRAAVQYGELARTLALKLKYGRKTAVARTMARYMERHLAEADRDAILVPVPLHRTRLWNRGFNQAALVARALSTRTGLALQPHVLRRVRRTPRLKEMSVSQRERIVAGAFAASKGNDLAGKTIVLVDDVYTTGSTANACARALKKAGAARVELVAWARVVRPARV